MKQKLDVQDRKFKKTTLKFLMYEHNQTTEELMKRPQGTAKEMSRRRRR